MPQSRLRPAKYLKLVAAIAVALQLGLAQVITAEAADSAVILIYHRFGEDRLPSTNIRIAQFKAHIAELTSGPYHVLGLDQITAALRSGTPLPERAVAITIDDAYRSVHDVAWPLLQAAGLPFTLFVATEPIDAGRPGYLSWPQLRALAEDGVIIGNHTVSHSHMLEADAAANTGEIAHASARLEAELGQRPRFFAYPYGEYSAALRDQIAAQGFDAAVAQFSAVADNGTDLFALPRFALNEKYGDIDRFRLIVNALPLGVRDITPADPLIRINPPAVGFTVPRAIDGLSALQCFPSHLGAAATLERLGPSRFEVRFTKPLPPGRSRMNCTMPGPDGRWRWFGLPFFVP